MSTPAADYIRALGRAMRHRRHRQHLTQEQVAEYAGLSANYFARIERGEINLTFEKVVRIAHALGTSPSSLMKAAERHIR